MSWARFDDRTPHHRKVKRLSDAAFRLWFTSVCYCAEYLTDGFIDAADVPEMPKVATGKKLEEAIRELESAGLWEVLEGVGWEVHDYLDWNPNGEAVKAKKQARSEAGRRGGQSSGKRRSKTEANGEAIASTLLEQTGSKSEPKTNPVPVPVPVPKEQAAACSEEAAPREPVRSDLNSLERALLVPIRDRAKLASKHLPTDSVLPTYCRPEEWPEVKELAYSMARSLGCSPALGAYSRDTGVRTLVELLAVFSGEELATAAERARTDEFVRGKGLSVLSVEVVRQLLQGGRAKPQRRGNPVQPSHGVNPFTLVPEQGSLLAEEADR